MAKATTADYELAERFPVKEDVWGFGKSPSDARISPDQVTRLITLGLIKVTSRGAGFCGADPYGKNDKSVGKHFGRRSTSFIRTFDKRPK